MRLTASQRLAIEHTRGNLQLIACAGSGKTEVVALRVVQLLRPGFDGALGPANIVAFTYTDKVVACPTTWKCGACDYGGMCTAGIAAAKSRGRG